MLNREPMGMKLGRCMVRFLVGIVSVLNREPMGMKHWFRYERAKLSGCVSVLNREPMGMKRT